MRRGALEADTDGHRPGGRRLALLLAGSDLSDAEARRVVAAESERIQAALGDDVVGSRTSLRVVDNPMVGTGSMMADSHYAAALEVDVVPEVGDDAVVAVVAGLADRHPTVDPARSSVLVGRPHVLRDRPVPPPGAAAPALRVVVAVRGAPHLTPAEMSAMWLRIGSVNASYHPTCAHYAQLHADPGLTARAQAAAGLTDGPFAGLAVEVFPTADDLFAGHAWAKTAESIDGSGLAGAHLMDLLGRCLDFSTARTLLAH